MTISVKLNSSEVLEALLAYVKAERAIEVDLTMAGLDVALSEDGDIKEVTIVEDKITF